MRICPITSNEMNPKEVLPTGKRVVHMKKFPLDGDREGKEASLFIVPINVKGWKCIHCVFIINIELYCFCCCLHEI